jgi:hypothetical protein
MGEIIKMSSCTVDYNKYMKGVDRANQYLPYYSVVVVGDQVTQSTVLYLPNSTLFNAFFCVQNFTPKSECNILVFARDRSAWNTEKHNSLRCCSSSSKGIYTLESQTGPSSQTIRGLQHKVEKITVQSRKKEVTKMAV